MFDQEVYEKYARQITACAIETNAAEALAWVKRRDEWIQNAVLAQARGAVLEPKPPPPAQQGTVVAPPWAEGREQSEIRLLLGPKLVGDSACELPPDPPPLPADEVVVGDLAWAGPPAVYACGPLDTAEPGTPATKDGKKLVKTQIPSPFGRGGFSRWYQEKV